MIALIPMMGLGSRFMNSGYSEYKPFVRINSEVLIKKIIKELNQNFDEIFIVCNPDTSKQLKSIFSDEIKVIELYTPTKGAAETISIACDYLPENAQIACIDCDTIFYQNAIKKITKKEGNFILTFKDEDKTGLYSYVILDSDKNVTDIQEKNAISEMANAGVYVFENKKLIQNTFNNLDDSGSELYISVLIKKMITNGHKFGVIDVTNEFDCCGTPYQLKRFSKNNIKNKKYTICFDIDGTLIYDLYKTPIKIDKNVEFCNQAYKEGHKIILHTARGMLSTNSNYDLIESKRPYIEKVLSDNGVLYHELILMKPYADVYIDDKAIPAHRDLEKETGIYLFEEHDSRVHNKIIVDGNKIVKMGKLKGESYYYNNIKSELKKFFPLVYNSSESMIEMEKINCPTYSSLLLSNKLTKEDITILINTISEIHPINNQNENLDLTWGYCGKIIDRFNSESDFYKILKIDTNKFIEISKSLKDFKLGIIHGDPVFTNIFSDKLNCKFIDVRGIWENTTTLYGDIFYDYAKILQSLYGYDYVLHNEPIEEEYIKTLRDHFFLEVKKKHENINIEELILKTKLLYVSLLPLHKEDLKRCNNFIKILNKL